MQTAIAPPGHVAGAQPPLPPGAGYVITADLRAPAYVGVRGGLLRLADATVFCSPSKAGFAADLYAARHAVRGALNYFVIPRRDALRLARPAF